jgi:nitrite reductase/ring-hydroxylating ferredoxin subunit
MARYVVGTVDEIPPGGRKIVEVAGRSIGVFNVKGQFYALLNRCPHQAGPLCEGHTFGFLRPGGVGEFHYTRPGEILRCPWHGWEFDVKTGQSWFDPRQVRVRRYEVAVEPGSALAAAEPTSETGMEGLEKGPYTAETYPVSVEQQYIIVEIGRSGGDPSHPRLGDEVR